MNILDTREDHALRSKMEFSFLIRRKDYKALVLLAISLLLVLNAKGSFITPVGADSKVHIVYLGERQRNDPEFVTQSHHQMLQAFLGSKEAARDSMVYSYRHGFSGFAAKLTESQAKEIAGLPGVINVLPDKFYRVETTRTWDYLDLSPSYPKNLLNDTHMGHQVIVGILDTGVWPESMVFNDKGMGQIPSRWKGGCESGQHFNALTACNKKLIGAKYYIHGFLAANQQYNITENHEYFSPRDYNGHGTHVSTIAAGSFVPNVSYRGLARGTVRGGAPKAHIAMYKVCWNWVSVGATCSSADILKAMDEAIHDGVDVLSLSIGFRVPLFPEIDVRDGIAVGAFHAVQKGIPVVCGAGNDGPAAQTVTNTAPWILTVAATTLDRSFPTPIILGNNITILGQAVYTGPQLGFTDLIYPDNLVNGNVTVYGICELLHLNPKHTMKGKVVLCFTTSTNNASVLRAGIAVRRAGGLGVIGAGNPTDILLPCPADFPCIAVDYELGTDILFYIRSTRSPVVKIKPSRTCVGRPVATKVATFSSRGPSSISPAILKPDIAAPGVSILAASTPNGSFSDGRFAIMSGTSMATPVVSGIIALLKTLHPSWSPAALRSAIVTTAWKTDPAGEPIFAEGSPRKLADPFDYGGGLVNPEKAAKPGLIYDMSTKDYIIYMCSAGYNDSSISQLVGKETVCPIPKPSVLDLNLPSITIPDLKDKMTLTRTVTNVGPINSTYKAVIEPPLGITIVVTPETLVFNSTTSRSLSFQARVSTTHNVNSGFYFGSLTWTDAVHNVIIPVSVRTQILQRYTDDN